MQMVSNSISILYLPSRLRVLEYMINLLKFVNFCRQSEEGAMEQ